MYVTVSIEDEKVSAPVVRLWPDEERIDIRYHGCVKAVSIEDVTDFADTLNELVMNPQEQAVEKIREALLEFRAKRGSISKQNSAVLQNRYASITRGTSALDAPTPAIVEPAPAAPPSFEEEREKIADEVIGMITSDHVGPALKKILTTEPKKRQPAKPRRTAVMEDPQTSAVPAGAPALRLANDKYEIFYAPGTKVRESTLPNGKVTEVRTTKPFGKMLKLERT